MDMKDKKELEKSADEKEKVEKEGGEDKVLEKSQVSGAIASLENLLKASPAGRREELLQKALAGPLTDEENLELRKSLGGGEDASLAADVSASLVSDELHKSLSLDVTGFLKEVHGGMTDALTAVAERLEKGFRQQDELGFALAKSHLDVCRVLQAQGELIKSLQGQIAAWGAQPVSAPRAVRGVAPATRHFGPPAGSDGGEERLSKAEILDGLLDLQKSASPDRANDIGFALVKYESTNHIAPSLYNELVERRRKSV